MRAIFMVLALVALPKAFSFSNVLHEEWHTFKLAYGKNYADDTEERLRFKAFKENKMLIAQHNQLFAAGEKAYEMALHEFSDMTSNAYGNNYRESSENHEAELTNTQNGEKAKNSMDSRKPRFFDDGESADNDESSTLLLILKEEWRAFKLTHNITYPNEAEDARHFEAFNENRLLIAKHNQLYHTGKKSFKLGVNHLSAMTREEYLKMVNCANVRNFSETNEVLEVPDFVLTPDLPKHVDWRDKRWVTEVKNQNQGKRCGSCWAFTTTGVIEGQHARKTGHLVSLSEQNLLDCSHNYHNYGCDGGYVENSLQYIKDNDGIDTEQSYPYLARTDYQCHFKRKNVGATAKGYGSLPSGDEYRLMQGVAIMGPIAVAIDAHHASFHHFKGKEVYDEPNCKSDIRNLRHAVLVVGYGTDENGVDYWLVKNSWGTNWGDNGYVRMSRNKGNQCGIATYAVYAVVSKIPKQDGTVDA